MSETKSDQSDLTGDADERSDSESGGQTPGSAADESAAVDEPLPVPRSRMLMSRDTATLLVIDVQEKLLPHIQQHSTIVWNIRRLIDGAGILNVATACTEQYPAGLGPTVQILSDRLTIDDEKTLFSCRDCRNLVERLRQENRHQVLLCGIESHVCVQQTALDLLAMGFDVWVAVDAVGSRYLLDHRTALRRLEMAGATLTTTEAALFEWCEIAGSHEFKRISALVREVAPPRTDIPDARYFPRHGSRYVVQTAHSQTENSDGSVTVALHFYVRSTDSGAVVREYTGVSKRSGSDAAEVLASEGQQSVEVSADGTAISVQDADGKINMVYLPVGEARSNHPRWKVRRSERHIASEQYRHDYEITFQVVDYKTDNTYREFTGYEHRDPDGGEFTHASGVRQIEISSDGRWIVVTELGRPAELIGLPPEKQDVSG